MAATTKTAKRITFGKVVDVKGSDYVDTRQDVLLDGVKVGEVTMTVTSVDVSPQSAMLGRFVSRKVHEVEATGYRAPRTERYSRKAAVEDFLIDHLGMSHRDMTIAMTGKAPW